jgi:preprotein translocase subunit SecF
MLPFSRLYDANYKKMLAAPALLLVLSLFLIFVYPAVTFGIDLKGGSMIILRSDMPVDAEILKDRILGSYPVEELSIMTTTSPDGSYGTIIQFLLNTDLVDMEDTIKEAELRVEGSPNEARQLLSGLQPELAEYGVTEQINTVNLHEAISQSKRLAAQAKDNFVMMLKELTKETFSLGVIKSQTREIGASLGKTFWESSIMVALVAAIFIVVVIFAFFREFVPSLAIIASAVLDVGFALGAMAVLSIPLSLSSIPALLMLVGYSVDTDIMLTTRLLKRKEGSIKERAYGAMKTGLTMTLTTMAALVVMIFLSHLYQVVVIFEITIVLFFGLVADLISTWLMNAPVLLWYAESKGGARR